MRVSEVAHYLLLLTDLITFASVSEFGFALFSC